MMKDPCYYKAYIAGCWDGVKDSASGKVADGQSVNIGKTPIQAMGLSTRTCNCLAYHGCTHVENLLALSSQDIFAMLDKGRKTASEIAHWLTEHGVLASAWSEYL